MGIFDKSNYIVNTGIQQSAMKYNGCRQCLYIRILVSITVLLTIYVLSSITQQFFQCTTKMILLAKMIKLWTFYENVVHS